MTTEKQWRALDRILAKIKVAAMAIDRIEITRAVARRLGKEPGQVEQSDLAEIEAFDLSDDIVNIHALQAFVQLKQLNLAFSSVSDISPLEQLHELRAIDLTSTRVSVLHPLRELLNLRELSLGNTPVDSLHPLKGLDLASLVVRGTMIADVSPLGEMYGLRTLSLASTRVTDIAPLFNLTNLEELDLRQCRVPHEDVERLRDALPNCTIYFDKDKQP